MNSKLNFVEEKSRNFVLKINRIPSTKNAYYSEQSAENSIACYFFEPAKNEHRQHRI